MNDRLADEQNQILNHCEQLRFTHFVVDDLIKPEFITATEIERANRYVAVSPPLERIRVDVIRANDGSIETVEASQELSDRPNQTEEPQPRRIGEMQFTIQLSEEVCQRVREVFGGIHRSSEEAARSEAYQQVRESMQRGLEAIAQARFMATVRRPDDRLDALSLALPHYGKRMALREAQIKTWCEQNGYTEPFSQEGQWWAFPPSGVMPVQLADVMGEERSPF